MKKRLAAIVFVPILIAAAYIGLAMVRMAQPYPLTSELVTFDLMPWEQYRAVAGEVEPPVLLETGGPAGAVLLFGAEHSNDPDHAQFARLEDEFAEFRPTVVVVEGRPGPLLSPFMNSIKSYGESGRLVELAKGAGLPAYSWELSREGEVQRLKERFSANQVAIYLLMRPFPGGATVAEAEQNLAAIIDDRGDRPGIANVIGDLEQFETAWQGNMDAGEDWRALSGVHNAPGFLGEMFEYGNDIRDQNMLNIVRELLQENERVMVTMGWSHAVRVEPALDQLVRPAP